MSHHFDTQVARDDSRLNVLDLYLFQGAAPDTTAMILTTNPDAGIFAPLTLHPEGLYAFRFDTDGDGRDRRLVRADARGQWKADRELATFSNTIAFCMDVASV